MPVPAGLHSRLRHGGVCQPFARSGCEGPTIAWHLALRLFLAFMMFPLLLLADESGNITGKVVESGGGRLTGVKVTLVNQETNTKRETVTAEDGRVSFPDLTPGTYLLQIEAVGFETYQTNIQVRADKPHPLRTKRQR